MSFKTFGFIGLGLMGGSIAKAIRFTQKDAVIIAYDSNHKSLLAAKEEGICDVILSDVSQDFNACDIIFLCTPVSWNNKYLPLLAHIKNENCILTDVGSVKNTIQSAILQNQLSDCFIGGHPMAGSEHSGFAFSDARLIENAYYVLTPAAAVSTEKIDKMQHFIQSLGSIPILLDGKTHDHVTAAISHLPHMIAFSLVNFVKQSDNTEGIMKCIAAGGFKDITRIASSSPVMWQQICSENKEEILSMMKHYIAALQTLSLEIENENAEGLLAYFQAAKDYRDSFDSLSSGPISKTYRITISIPDETGMIATISGLFAKENINIKNIGILHNREFEEGALGIEFYDEYSLNNAVLLLKQHNYHINTQ